MPLSRDPDREEIGIITRIIAAAVKAYLVRHGLVLRLEQHTPDFQSELMIEFLGFWRTKFEYGVGAEDGLSPEEIMHKALSMAIWPMVMNRMVDLTRQYANAVHFKRAGAAAGMGTRADDLINDDLLESQQGHAADDRLIAAEFRERVKKRLLWLAAHDKRPTWWRGIDVASGLSLRDLGIRDALTRHQAYRGAEMLLRLFKRDPVLVRLVAENPELKDQLAVAFRELAANPPPSMHLRLRVSWQVAIDFDAVWARDGSGIPRVEGVPAPGRRFARTEELGLAAKPLIMMQPCRGPAGGMVDRRRSVVPVVVDPRQVALLDRPDGTGPPVRSSPRSGPERTGPIQDEEPRCRRPRHSAGPSCRSRPAATPRHGSARTGWGGGRARLGQRPSAGSSCGRPGALPA